MRVLPLLLTALLMPPGLALASVPEGPAQPAPAPAAEPAADEAAAAADDATAEDELEEMQEAESQLVSGASRVERELDRQRTSLWRDRLSGALGLYDPTCPAEASSEHGDLPFALDSVRARYDIPLDYNEQVADYIAFFQGAGRKVFTHWLARSTRWIPLFRQILHEHGVPEDLVYLSMIESGFSMNATSWARATGPWQFIAGTGKLYGLTSDFWLDERRDPIKSTHAAARYLKRLHDDWGDWYLAWASYNAGPGRVKKAIARNGSQDFWTLHDARGAFRRETQGYVPKLIAAALIAKYPEKFGFTEVEWQKPLAWEEVQVSDATDLAVIAKCAGVSEDDVRELNPELRRWATPPTHGKPFTVKLPVGHKDHFAEAYARVLPSERFTFRAYVVQRGDTLGRIALMFGSSVEAVMKANRLADPRRLHPGQELVIPTPPGTRAGRVRVAKAEPAEAPSPRPVLARSAETSGGSFHVIAAGETLGNVAERFGCSISQLRRWNHIRNVRRLQVGQRLRVKSADPG